MADLTIYRNGNFDIFFHAPGFGGDMHQVGFSRYSFAELNRSIRATRAHHSLVTKLRMRGTVVSYGQGDITFYYAWHEQGRTYFVSSKYYGGIRPSDLRMMVRSAAQLPSVPPKPPALRPGSEYGLAQTRSRPPAR